MLHLPLTTLLVFVPINFGRIFGSIVEASGTLTKPLTNSSFYPIPKTTNQVTSVQSLNDSYIQSQNQRSTTAKRPSGTLGALNSAGPSSSAVFHDGPQLQETCVLWNTSCSGNKSHAMNEFFTNTTLALYTDECFLGWPNNCGDVTSSEQLSRYGQAKHWMNSPQCYSDYAKWSSLYSIRAPPAPVVVDKNNFQFAEIEQLCCSGCAINAGNVDIYYWPEANASTSCLDIIGNSIHPLDYGATTHSTDTYWGCTGQDMTLTKTASVTTSGSISQKVNLYNSWSSDPCSRHPSLPLNASTSTGPNDPHPSIFARAHLLTTQSSFQNSKLPMAFAVVGSYTL